MRNFLKKDISCRRELSLLLTGLDRRWKSIVSIKDGRRRGKEILKFRVAIKNLLHEYKRNNSNNSIDKSVVTELIRWINRNSAESNV